MINACYLEALAVDNAWTSIVVLLVSDDHLWESSKGSEDRTSDPNCILTLWWGDNLDLHGWWGKGGDFLLDTLWKAAEHGGTAGEDDVGVEVLPDIDIALHDGVEEGLVDTVEFEAVHVWLEEEFWAAEPLVSDGDDVAIWKGVGNIALAGVLGLVHLGGVVVGNIGKLLLDVTDDFLFGRGGEGVATLVEDLLEPGGEVTAGEVEPHDGVWEGVTLVDWDGVGNTITSVEDDTGGTARAVEGKNGLDTDIEGWNVEGFEHELDHLFTVSLWVHWGLGEENWVLSWVNTELVVESVVPDLLHIVPVGDDTVLDWVLEDEDTSLSASLITDIGVLVLATSDSLDILWTSDDGWEDGTWSFVTSETGLAHTGTIIDNKCLNFVSHY